MATINMFRQLLVAGAALAVVVALAYQQWAAAAILSVGIAAHIALWVRIHRERAAAAADQPPSPSAS